MLPKVTIEGNLTDEPELRFTPQGVPVASFTVAANSRRRAPDGSWQDGDPLFLRVTCWRQLAENVADSLHRGTSVVVVGELKQNSYEDREGNKRTSYEVNAQNVGPSLRYATTDVKKVGREQPQQQQQITDPWASGQPQGDPWASDQPEEPPF